MLIAITHWIKTNLIKILLLFVASLFIQACTSTVPKQDKPILSVSILPQKYFVEKLCGDQFHVHVMIPPGESPATYDPTPRQIIQMTKSSTYFLIGHLAFEKTWISNLSKTGPDTEFIDTSAGIDFEMDSHGNHGHTHQGVEPHIWMSPKNTKIIIKNMLDHLIKAYPDKSDFYLNNHMIFQNELDSLDQLIKNSLGDIQSREFIIYHPALTYYARDYELIQIPLENEGKEPSAKYMKRVINRAKSNNIKAILVQKQFNVREAQITEKEINGKIIPIDPLDYKWMDQMISITRDLKSALQ